MSDACFHNFDLNRMIYKAISTNDLPSALANLVVKTPFPVFFACLFKSSFTPSKDSAILCELFGHSFANGFLQNRDFFSTHRNSIPYTRGVLMCLLTFWPFPAFFACLFKSSFTPRGIHQSFVNFLGNPLRTVFSKIKIFSQHTKILYPIPGES